MAAWLPRMQLTPLKQIQTWNVHHASSPSGSSDHPHYILQPDADSITATSELATYRSSKNLMSFIQEGVPLVETVKQPIVELTHHPDASPSHHFSFFPPPPPAIYNRSAETTTRSCREREHMFEKVVTPSDVGKLNRLVIPKQHAEKYFPLDSSSPESGRQSLLLNFEDSSGKPWRFRYSYWSSSQSFVITKGWSRFVKEKKLVAGDVVSFDREISDCVRFFIDWRRRTNMGAVQLRPVPWGRVFFSPTSCYTKFNYSCNYHVFNPASLRYDPFGQAIASSTGGGDRSAVVLESVPVVPRRTVGKRVRLFGVNLDCPSEEEGEGCSSAIVPAMAHKPYPSTSMQLISRDLQRRSKLSLSPDLDV